MNHAADYAIRAAVFLAHDRDRRATAAHIADRLGLPRNYLSKVLHVMARAGLLASTRGPRGGFQLCDAPEQLTLARVTEPFRQDQTAPVWYRGVTEQMSFFLNTTTVQMLLEHERIDDGGSYVKQRRAQ